MPNDVSHNIKTSNIINDINNKIAKWVSKTINKQQQNDNKKKNTHTY